MYTTLSSSPPPLSASPRKLLQVPFPYDSASQEPENIFIVAVVISGLAAAILTITSIKLVRISYHTPDPSYCKKIVHISIAIQMIGCIMQNLEIANVTQYDCWLYFAIQELNFLTEGAAYFTLLMFWTNFYFRIVHNRVLWPFQSNAFGISVTVVAAAYLSLFCWYCHKKVEDDCRTGWYILRIYLYWWHVGFFIIAAIAFLVITIKLRIQIETLHGRFKHKRKTLKVLSVLAILTVFRSVVDGVFEHVPETNKIAFIYWDTWVGFFTYFMLESLIPSVIFLILLGKIPNAQQRERQNASRFDSGYVRIPSAPDSEATLFAKIINF